MTWARRADNIRQRDWDDVLSLWIESGHGFDTADFMKTSLDVAIESVLSPTSLAGNRLEIIEFDQRTTFLSELVFANVKANHAVISAALRIAEGRSTWGTTDAYHASMLLMRSILAAFGVFVCRIHERNVLVDTFPWLGRIDERKKFAKAHRNWKRCASVISSTTKDFTQTDLFSLFKRILNISVVSTKIWPEVVIQNIIATDKAHFSASRNKLIYSSRFWFNYDDLLGECLSLSWKDQVAKNMASYTFSKTEEATEIDCYCDCWVLFCLNHALQKQIFASIDDSIGVVSYVEERREECRLIEMQFLSGWFQN
jgi:hypothetical protein